MTDSTSPIPQVEPTAQVTPNGVPSAPIDTAKAAQPQAAMNVEKGILGAILVALVLFVVGMCRQWQDLPQDQPEITAKVSESRDAPAAHRTPHHYD